MGETEMHGKKPKLSYLSMLVMLNLGVATTVSAAEENQKEKQQESRRKTKKDSKQRY